MRILHICQRDDLSTGGATRLAFDLVEGQRLQGADVQLLFLYGEPGELGRKMASGTTHYLGLSSAREVPLKGWKIRRLLKACNPDMVHHHDMLTWPQFVHLLPHRYRIIFHTHLDHRPPRTGKTRIAWWLTKRNSDAFVSPSSYGAECLAEAGIPRHKISVIPNGTPCPVEMNTADARARLRQLHGIGPDRIILGWGGRLHCGAKGTDDFIRLFNHLPEEYVGLVAGQGPDEELLKELVAESGLIQRVFFHGLEQNMAHFYQGIDALVLTSHFESFGLVVVEALANRIPVFAFVARGGIVDLLSLPGVTTVDDRSLETMAERIQDAFSEPGKMVDAAAEGKLVVEQRYSIKRMATDSVALYASLEQG